MEYQIVMSNTKSVQPCQDNPPENSVFDAAIQTMLNKTILDSLKSIVIALTILYGLLAIGQFFLQATITFPAVVIAQAISAVLYLLLFMFLQQQTISARLVHPIGAIAGAIVLINNLLHLNLGNSPPQTISLLLLIVGFGSLMTSTGWVIFGSTITYCSWLLVAWPRLDPTDLSRFSLGFIVAIGLSMIIHFSRIKLLHHLEMVHQQVKMQKKDLQTRYQSEVSRHRLTEMLYQMSKALSQITGVSEMLDRLLDDVAKIVPYDQAAILLLYQEGFQISATQGFPEGIDLSPLHLSLQKNTNNIYEQINRSQQPFMVPDISTWAEWPFREILPSARAWLGVPLVQQNKIIAILSLTRNKATAYSEADIIRAMALADQAAIALDNAQLYDRLLHFIEDLEDEVEERTSDLQVAYIQLDRISQSKSDFILVASHELRTPLTVLQGYSEMLLKMSLVQADDYILKMVEGVHAGTQRLTEIVTNLTDMAKIDSDSLDLRFSPVSISGVIQLAYEEFQAAFKERNLSYQIRGLNQIPLILADPDALQKVFSHLISNAIKYTPDGGTITLSGQILLNGTEMMAEPAIKITVADTGIGIDKHLHHFIFAKFAQVEDLALHSTSRTNFKGGGPGLGLAIAKGMIEAHRGKIWIESAGYDEETLPGSQIQVLLPVGLGQP